MFVGFWERVLCLAEKGFGDVFKDVSLALKGGQSGCGPGLGLTLGRY